MSVAKRAKPERYKEQNRIIQVEKDLSDHLACLVTLLGCLLSSGWEILVGLSRMGFSCFASGLLLSSISFLASVYSVSLCPKYFIGGAGLAEWDYCARCTSSASLRSRSVGKDRREGCHPESISALQEETVLKNRFAPGIYATAK